MGLSLQLLLPELQLDHDLLLLQVSLQPDLIFLLELAYPLQLFVEVAGMGLNTVGADLYLPPFSQPRLHVH